MGDDYAGQDKAIEELRALSDEAKGFLNHHLGNPLSVIIGDAYLRGDKRTEEAAWHIVRDLEKAGIREKKR